MNTTVDRIKWYSEDTLDDVRARRIMADADAMIRTSNEIRALPETKERS